MTTFYLIRHAHADWTPDENRPLSPRGYEDAARVAEILGQFPISLIYSSPYRRARQTIAPLATRLGLPVHTEPDLRERRLGNIATVGFFKAVESTWQNPSFVYPDGESNASAQKRGLAVVRRLQKRYSAGHIVLSTHGNLLALIMQGVDPSIDYAFWKSLTMPDIYTLRFSKVGQVSTCRLWSETDVR